MSVSTAVHTIGFYCGRHGPGLFDEAQNSLTNLAFLLGAWWAWRTWRTHTPGDRFALLLVVMLACIGVGSFVFHSHPRPWTLYIDLVPIQLYTLALLAYTLTRLLGCSPFTTAVCLLAFFALRQAWIAFAPPGLLGGGVTHLPALVALLAMVVALARRNAAAWKYLVAGALLYVAALSVRTLDLPLCTQFPLGVHWLWHLLTASAGTVVLLGVLRSAAAPQAPQPA